MCVPGRYCLVSAAQAAVVPLSSGPLAYYLPCYCHCLTACVTRAGLTGTAAGRASEPQLRGAPLFAQDAVLPGAEAHAHSHVFFLHSAFCMRGAETKGTATLAGRSFKRVSQA